MASYLRSGIVWSSDGTVYTNKLYYRFSNNTVNYESKADDLFRRSCRNGSRENYGWMAYSKTKGKATYFELKKLTTIHF